MCFVPGLAAAQEPPPAPDQPVTLPDSASEPEGLIPEPGAITRAVIFVDRHRGKGDLSNGFYIDFGNMIPGAGWISGGPGYRRWFGRDRALFDASAAVSWNGYKSVQARTEWRRFLKSRLPLGVQVRGIDYSEIDYYGDGPDSREDALTQYGMRAAHAVAFADLRPTRWLTLGAESGLLVTRVRHVGLDRGAADADETTFLPTEVSITVDTRNFPDHPTSGVVLRAAGAHFEDRDRAAFSFRRYEGEAAAFVPLASERVVLGLHGWMVNTEPENGSTVPFYLLPSLGGAYSLRSYSSYRFHDRSMLVANAEVRLKLMTHLDLAMFADAGNVAPRWRDLDLDKRSYGMGLRLHTRRQTFMLVDVAHGEEGWRAEVRMKDPLSLGRLQRRAAVVPFVP